MPVLTNYWFEDTDFRGMTQFLNIAHGAGAWAWINWANIGSKDSTLVWEREDREQVLDLVSLLNFPDVLNELDALVGGGRTSPLRGGWIPWKYVPYRNQDPARHHDLDLLVRLSFDFHVSTPAYCTDANGTIHFYGVPYLESSGRARGYIDGWSYHYDGGGPFCTGSISDSLDSSVPAGAQKIQEAIDIRLELIADRRFDLLYLLPGDGARTGGGSVNVNDSISIAALPRPSDGGQK
jgi:hypothetical protein